MSEQRKRLFDLSDVSLYFVTTPPRDGTSYVDQVARACAGGIAVPLHCDQTEAPSGLLWLK